MSGLELQPIVVVCPAYIQPVAQPTLPGAPRASSHPIANSRIFYPVGSRLGVFGNIGAGFRLLPTCWGALVADPTLLFVPIAVLFVGGVAATGYIIALGGLAQLMTGGQGAVAVKLRPLAVVLGTQLTAQAVLSFAIAACTIPLVIVAIVIASANSALGIALLVAILLAAIAVSSALNGVLSAAMYRFATTGMLAPGFDEADMWSVFAGR